ncbi:MAG: zf-HC2 domain-containing protein [Ornithinimicrobium sp.]
MSMQSPWKSAWTMVECHWSARRLQRYLDADPSALLSASEVDRLEKHLAACERCSALLGEYRGLQRVFARWASQSQPDAAAIARLDAFARSLASGDKR